MANKNLLTVRHVLADMGASVLEERTKGRHIRLRVRTAAGIEFWYSTTQGANDAHKEKGWARQQVRRADSRAAHLKQLHGR